LRLAIFGSPPALSRVRTPAIGGRLSFPQALDAVWRYLEEPDVVEGDLPPDEVAPESTGSGLSSG